MNHRPMVFWTPISMESVADSHRGDALMNRHRVGHRFYLQTLYELPPVECVAMRHCSMVFCTPISMESFADSHRGVVLLNRRQVGHQFHAQSLCGLSLIECVAMSRCPMVFGHQFFYGVLRGQPSWRCSVEPTPRRQSVSCTTSR